MKYQTIFENASDAMMVVDSENLSVTDANKSMRELCLLPEKEIPGFSVEKLMPSKIAESTHSKSFSKVHLNSPGFYEDVLLKTTGNILKNVDASIQKLDLKGHNLLLCVFRNIEEKKKMERTLIEKHSELKKAFASLEHANEELKSMQEALIQSGKMAALGQLSAGIAHELNQPLTVIKGYSQEALALFDDREKVKNSLKEIEKASSKMQKIISHLRNFTRKSTQDHKFVTLFEVVSEALSMFQKQFETHGITTTTSIPKDLPQIYCDPLQLEQVFVNLATNARDAIDEAGRKAGTIKISARLFDEKLIEVSFEDNGCGIEDTAKSKIFNPFFTTKEVGKGTGLGLSILYGILSKINASVMVESTYGKGAKFIIKIPVDYRKH